MSKFKKTMLMIESILLPFLGIFLLGFHEKLDIDFLEASLFLLIFIEISNFKQFQLEVEDVKKI